MFRSRPKFLFLAALLVLVPAGDAQNSPMPVEQYLRQIYAVPSVSGDEERMAEKIVSLLGGSCVRDRIGSVYHTRGESGRHLALVVGLDEYGFIVSGIRSDGFLNLDRVVPEPRPLFDFNQFGHPLRIWKEKGWVDGILSLPSLHTAPREFRQSPTEYLTLEKALIDIGAKSGLEAAQRGVAVLDSVTPRHDISTLAGDKKAGYSLGDKTCSALLLAAARGLDNPSARISFLWMAQSKFPYRRIRPAGSLGALSAARNFKADSFIVIGIIPIVKDDPDIRQGMGPVLLAGGDRSVQLMETVESGARDIYSAVQISKNLQSPLLNSFISEGKEAVGLFLPVLFAGTSAEVVDFQDVKALFRLVLKLTGSEGE